MSATLAGNGAALTISYSRDQEGYRDYTVVHQVKTSSALDGPRVAVSAPGLPLVGSVYSFGNDYDQWAFCWPDRKVTMIDEKENTRFWRVESHFSTKPLSRCQDEEVEDPLLEPQKISGSFVKYTKEAVTDRDGQYIRNSAHELFRGAQVEFDESKPNVRIEQNVAHLELPLCSSMMDCLNDRDLWGLSPRCIKLSGFSWERKVYGQCNYYFTRVFDFDVKYDTFDKDLLDEGTKVLNGFWDLTTGAYITKKINGLDPDADNPQHFIRYKDRNGENARVVLNGQGLPASTMIVSGTGTGTGTTGVGSSSGDPGVIHVEKYEEANFLLLGIPTSFE